MIFGKLFGLFKPKKKRRPQKVDRGRYLFKPIMGRTLRFIMSIDENELIDLVENNQLMINGQPVTMDRLAERLESGKYLVTQDDGSSWRFFIV